MSKKKPAKTRRDVPAPEPAAEAAGPSPNFVVFRETVESLVVAFVLAFLFRTFEAEAFVIPTGSMSPSLQGRHKDVNCTQCGYRFRTTASSEDVEDLGRRNPYPNPTDAEVVAGMCPMCRYPMPFTSNLPSGAIDQVEAIANVEEIDSHTSYPGDRILVNKYGLDFSEPERWDVIVFKFPGNGEMNYIKRLVGLPNEELQVYQGDVFARPLVDGEGQGEFRILRKPPHKAAAMLQHVADTDYESALMHKAGWPLRWAATTPDGWNVDAQADDGALTVAQTFTIDKAADAPTAWLRYRHQIPDQTIDWALASALVDAGSLEDLARREGTTQAELDEAWKSSVRPQLITDFNAYNARLLRGQLKAGAAWSMEAQTGVRGLEFGFLGDNWVGDLAVEADVEIEEGRGSLTLEVVEAGYQFQATIDLKTGRAKLGIIDARTGEPLDFAAEAATPIDGPGKYELRFANVDDQLVLWVDGDPVEFDDSTYDPDVVFAATGGRERMIPWTSEDRTNAGDLAPAGVGATGAKATISRLAVLRDVYYIAANETMGYDAMHMDYHPWRLSTDVDGQHVPRLDNGRDLFAVPAAWPRFLTRRPAPFKINNNQLFVMGDNSPESKDCRLWKEGDFESGIPGGRYLDRRLLIGKAVCVFWPHSWGSIPGLPQLPGFPNFGDMRLVR